MPGAPLSGQLGSLSPITRPTVADWIFDRLHQQILSLELPPGARLSESEVGAAMGVSRQPVRDAFYRLSKLGFLTIRPQVATVIAPISARAVMEARFIRMAIELETTRTACRRMTAEDHDALAEIIDRQRHAVEAGDKVGFHALDDAFHREICARSGHAHAWQTIRETKAHMDRVRFLTLAFASQDAFGDHIVILDALKARDEDAAVAALRQHLGRISGQIERVRGEHEALFADEPAEDIPND